MLGESVSHSQLTLALGEIGPLIRFHLEFGFRRSNIEVVRLLSEEEISAQ